VRCFQANSKGDEHRGISGSFIEKHDKQLVESVYEASFSSANAGQLKVSVRVAIFLGRLRKLFLCMKHPSFRCSMGCLGLCHQLTLSHVF